MYLFTLHNSLSIQLLTFVPTLPTLYSLSPTILSLSSNQLSLGATALSLPPCIINLVVLTIGRNPVGAIAHSSLPSAVTIYNS
jgi:hypothetical protein